MKHTQARDLGCTGHQVICQRRSKWLAGFIVAHLLVESGTDPLGGTAIGLPLYHHWIHERSAIMHNDVVENFDGPDPRIHGHEAGVRAIREVAALALRLITTPAFEPTRLYI